MEVRLLGLLGEEARCLYSKTQTYQQQTNDVGCCLICVVLLKKKVVNLFNCLVFCVAFVLQVVDGITMWVLFNLFVLLKKKVV